MKIKIQLNDGYEEIIEVDEEEGEIKDLGSTKEMLQGRIEKLEELNRSISGDVAFYHEANQECKKEIESLRGKANAWEKRCEELEQENLDLKQELDTVRSQRAEVCEAKAQEVQKRMALEKELGEQRKENADLFHEHREILDKLDEYQRRVAGLKLDNRDLQNKLEKYETVAANWKWDKGSTALTRWAKAIHENAVEHGWWAKQDAADESFTNDGDRPFPEIVALCHSELSEALEEYRNEKPMAYINGFWPEYDTGFGEGKPIHVMELDKWPADAKPEGVAVEMIDCIIRILDWCGKENIDVDAVLRRKHEYNKSRPYRHGGKKA